MGRSTGERPRARRRVSPRGDEFEVVGRAGPVRFERAPHVPAEAREELLVLKDGDLFLCARPDGDIHPARVTGEGLYASDTRFLSELRLELGGTPPVALSYAADEGYRAVVDATNATLRVDEGTTVEQQSLNLQRVLVIAGRLYHLARLGSYLPHPVTTTLSLSLAGDFADMFEVRGGPRRDARGHALAPKRLDRGLALAYVGEDERFRETVVAFEPQPAEVILDGSRATAIWEVELRPREPSSLLVTVEPSIEGRRRRRRRLDTSTARLKAADSDWRTSCTAVESDNELFDKLITASVRDLRVLLTPAPGGRIVAGGVPWYVAPFGRDSLVTAYESLLLNPGLARDTLTVLARLQARAEDPWRDAEPGKIPHELRAGELAGAGIIPHTPYYGSVDSTPLFLLLAAAHYRWTGDLEAMARLRPSLDAGLRWIDEHGDADRDGFVEYERRSPAGLRNQGWKDSWDSVMHADGTLAEGPIALVEVQGYVYLAKLRIADVYEALGARDVAERLRDQANELRRAFDEAFWDPEEGTFALALDGRKRQVRSVTSNPGHCLYCAIVDPRKAEAVAERLMAPDMFCGWGIRTLSSDSPAFNPMSYHNGSVWPHDNAIAAAGLKRYGFHDAAERVATALFDVASDARDFRLPELYCGFDRDGATSPVAYPVACIPQAWAAAAPFMLLQAMLGISAGAPDGALQIHRPTLPAWLGRLELHGLRVGTSTLSLAFERDNGITGVSLLRQRGTIEVNVALDPEPDIGSPRRR
jgi:glycogen debranching enzyme